jgi:hypothetical protein
MPPPVMADNYNDVMLVLRYAYLLALVLLLGGLLAIGGIVAPAVFAAFTGSHGMAGREMAGLAVGAVLARFHLVAYAALAIMGIALGAMAALGPRPVRFGVRMVIVALMLIATLYSGIVIGARIERLRREINGVVAELPASDPRRAQFGRLHGLSTALLSVAAVGGLTLLYWEARHD